MKSLHAFIALCLSLVLTLPASAAEWLRADTPNFVIYSDGYPHEVTRWAKRVEMLDALLRVRFDKPGPRKGTKLTIYMVENSNAVERLTGRKNLHGLYSPSSEGSFAITHRKLAYYDNQLSGQMTLFHEYAHHFMFRNFPSAYPAWYREGFAEFVSTVEFDIDGAATFGLPSGYRAKHLRKSPPPMEKLLLADVGNIKPKVRAPFYAWSWLLVHMLNSDPARAAQLRDYLARFAAGAGPEQAAGAFGDLHALERSLEAYSKQRPQALEKYPPIAAETEIKVTALGPLGSELVELGLERRLGKNLSRSVDRLSDLAGRYPHSADVWVELARAERDIAKREAKPDFDRAEAMVDRALALASDNSDARVLKAEFTFERMLRNSSGTPADWLTTRRQLAATLEDDLDNAEGLMALFQSHIMERTPPSQGAFMAMERAFHLQPESKEIRLSYAISLALRGQYDRAKKVIRVLSSDPHAPGLGQRTLVKLEQMEAAAKGRTPQQRVAPD